MFRLKFPIGSVAGPDSRGVAGAGLPLPERGCCSPELPRPAAAPVSPQTHTEGPCSCPSPNSNRARAPQLGPPDQVMSLETSAQRGLRAAVR